MKKIIKNVGKAMASPLGKAVLVGVGLGGVAVAASALNKAGAFDGMSPNAKGAAMRNPGPAGGPGTGSQATPAQMGAMSRSGVARPSYAQPGSYKRGKFVSPYSPAFEG